MPAYLYRAAESGGRVRRGTVTAVNENDLAQYLGRAGLELIDAREKKTARCRPHAMGTVSPRALADFCAQMKDLLQAGVPFLDALHDLGDGMDSSTLRDAIGDIARAVSHGSNIAAAFARHPRLFPPVFTAILASGASSGDLTRTFGQLARHTDGRARLNENIRRALRYPLFLLAVALGVVTFMMALVVPQIVQFLASIDGQLPLMTRVLIGVSDWFGRFWWMAGLGASALVIAGIALRRTSDRAARIIDGLALRIPVAGIVYRKIMLARFMQTFAILMQSGVGIPECLRNARGTLGNHALEALADEAGRAVQTGRSLSAAMKILLPPFAVRILRIGEQNGQLGKSLDDIAITYDREAKDAIERLIGALEPALTAMVGGIMMWIVLAVMGPIYGSVAKLNAMG